MVLSARCLEKGLSLRQIDKKLRTLINKYEGLNRNERSALFSTAHRLTRMAKASKDEWKTTFSQRQVFDSVAKSVRKVNAHKSLREKRSDTRSALNSGTVFFLCSSHFRPAKDHAPFQGLVYVDRFWRSKVDGNDYHKVASYIRNHKTKTVQEIMGPPVYLTTRPYCKHFLIPLSVQEVLGSSVRQIRLKYTKQPTAFDYYKERGKVYSVLNFEIPCDEFRSVVARSRV